MPEPAVVSGIADRMERYLTGSLLPFWQERTPDPQFGGFLCHFDADGRPTGETEKTFLSHVRILYTMSAAARAGYDVPQCRELAGRAADFLLKHFWDDEHGGWFWVADRAGRPTVTAKVGYGQVFGVYAFSEYSLATGDDRGREAAERTCDAIVRHMSDGRRGGLMELMTRDWRPERPGRFGGDRKSMDVHMHWMEALTTYYEMTGRPADRRRLEEAIDLIVSRMLHGEHGTGWIQFTLDFQPLAAILFATQWGRDVERTADQARPMDNTSYGHNVEFAWLLLHAADVMGVGRWTWAEVVRPIFEHCVRYGIDREHGGVFVEGPHAGPTGVTESKQFWQQAEVMVGMLDAWSMFGDEAYWDAFVNVHDFVFDHFVNEPAGGEWRERVTRTGEPLDPTLGHGWKVCYHTVRSMIQCIARLRALGDSGERQAGGS